MIKTTSFLRQENLGHVFKEKYNFKRRESFYFRIKERKVFKTIAKQFLGKFYFSPNMKKWANR